MSDLPLLIVFTAFLIIHAWVLCRSCEEIVKIVRISYYAKNRRLKTYEATQKPATLLTRPITGEVAKFVRGLSSTQKR